MPRPNILLEVGAKYGDWTVLKRDLSTTHTYYYCVCKCGVVRSIRGYVLRTGESQSCLACSKTSDVPGYFAIHKRLLRAFGKATEHKCWCGEQADEWAYMHNDSEEMVDFSSGLPYSRDLRNYEPLCRSHHRKLDYKGGRK